MGAGVLLALFAATFAARLATAAEPVRLVVKEVPLKVLGREVAAVAIEQADGTQGLFPEQAAGFDVEVVNQLKVPTTIHWHGLVLPNLMDGVPFVTQAPIAPGGSFHYKFPLTQQGTYWMHSHYGLQEQFLASAPLVIWTPQERAKSDRQHVVMLTDFSFTAPAEILMKLRGGMKMPMPETKPGQGAGKGDDRKVMTEMPRPAPIEMIGQAWDDAAHAFVRTTVRAPAPDIDVAYDALLANRRTLDDPEVVRVNAGETVLLRMIAASSSTNFVVDTGALTAELLAVDGKAVQPMKGTFFQLGIAQRIDLRVTIPAGGGAFPILAQGEGTKLLCGVVLATQDAAPPRLSATAALAAAALDNTQERRLRAVESLAPHAVDRTVPSVLGGDMATYVWTINGIAYPTRDTPVIRRGERVELVMTNKTMMAHPMHLHGHDMQVVAIDGDRIAGAMRDTVVVPPRSAITVAFDAANPGVWAFHCHLIYHMATGMFSVLRYEDADASFWQPEKSTGEVLGLR